MGLHYMAVIDNPYPFLECGIEDDRWALYSYDPQVEIANGRVTVPTAPGWGFTPTLKFLETSQYAISRAT